MVSLGGGELFLKQTEGGVGPLIQRNRYTSILVFGNVRFLSVGRDISVGMARLAMAWTVWGSNPGGGDILCIRPNRPGCGVNPPVSSTDVKERVERYLYFSSGPSWPVLGRTLPFTICQRFFTAAIL